ncbi:hypothetical protein FXB40_11100 [Bradyrhizobium rifense]|uniref:Uncharacterized protein n=1 Tax=Bradyrhizobium rifense TaxID=515499 RepID=A0A5D3KKL5_9BRAD|nr:hypothetical protein [Bradyrhizobium rifense]TYL96593.1 hypothetical protein FXB40_11100 [Bradyrhizobium rifense]
MAKPDSLALLSVTAKIASGLKRILGFSEPKFGAMFDEAAKFRGEYEYCRRQAGMTRDPSSKARWLLFAAEWLERAETAEALAKREAAETVSAK